MAQCSYLHKDGQCGDNAHPDYCGYCPHCWIQLPAKGREILLRDRRPPVPPAPVTHEHHEHLTTIHNPPQSRLATFVLTALAVPVGYGIVLIIKWLGW